MADEKLQLNVFDAYREMIRESNEKTKQNSIAITHSIQKARKLVAFALNKVGVQPSDYYYSSANQNRGKHSAFSVKWTAKQEQEFNAILDQLQDKKPEVVAIEIY
jgi:hypothetical protein